jgi:hypothetical protein
LQKFFVTRFSHDEGQAVTSWRYAYTVRNFLQTLHEYYGTALIIELLKNILALSSAV